MGSEQASPEPEALKRKGGLPVLWRVSAAWRLLRDPQARLWEKALLLCAAAYVAMPLDLVPDLAAFVGWLDDLGVVVGASVVLQKALSRYRGKAADKQSH